MSIDQQRRGTENRTSPNRLRFDLRIQCKCGTAWLGQTEIDRVAEVVTCETESQVGAFLPHRAFDFVLTPLHCTAGVFRTGPERRLQSTFTRERWNHASLRGFC